MNRHGKCVLAGGVTFGFAALLSATVWAQPPTPQLRFVIPGLEKPQATAAVPNATPMVLPAVTGGYWWNDARIVQSLGLTDVRRKDLDNTAESILSTQSAIQVRQIEARKQYETALTARDWNAARKAAADWNQTLAESFGLDSTLKIEVLTKLEAEEQKKLFSVYPYLLRQPWAGGSAQGRRPVGAPSAPGAPPLPATR